MATTVSEATIQISHVNPDKEKLRASLRDWMKRLADDLVTCMQQDEDALGRPGWYQISVKLEGIPHNYEYPRCSCARDANTDDTRRWDPSCDLHGDATSGT